MQLTPHEILVLFTGILGGGLGVTLFAQGFKKVFGLESSAAIHTMVVAITALLSTVQYSRYLKGVSVSVFGITGPAMYGFSQVLYKYAGYAREFLTTVGSTYAAGKAASPATVAATPAAEAVDPAVVSAADVAAETPVAPIAPIEAGF